MAQAIATDLKEIHNKCLRHNKARYGTLLPFTQHAFLPLACKLFRMLTLHGPSILQEFYPSCLLYLSLNYLQHNVYPTCVH